LVYRGGTQPTQHRDTAAKTPTPLSPTRRSRQRGGEAMAREWPPVGRKWRHGERTNRARVRAPGLRAARGASSETRQHICTPTERNRRSGEDEQGQGREEGNTWALTERRGTRLLVCLSVGGSVTSSLRWTCGSRPRPPCERSQRRPSRGRSGPERRYRCPHRRRRRRRAAPRCKCSRPD